MLRQINIVVFPIFKFLTFGTLSHSTRISDYLFLFLFEHYIAWVRISKIFLFFALIVGALI